MLTKQDEFGKALFKQTNTVFYTFPALLDHRDIETPTPPFSVRAPVGDEDRCPCGSGKKYGQCHSPKRDTSDSNHWRGPGFPSSIYFGYKEKFNGFDFQDGPRGEFLLLKDNNRIPLGRFFTMDASIVKNKAIVSSLVVKQHNDELVFSGIVDVVGDSERDVQLLIGTDNLTALSAFDAEAAGKPASHERAHWLGYIGIANNPISAAESFKWYRYFTGQGFLVDFRPGRQMTFRMTTRLTDQNIFTICLPFGQIELAQPEIRVSADFSVVSIEAERENVYWDLILHGDLFAERGRKQKDSLFAAGVAQAIDSNTVQGIRTVLSGPRKLRISIAK